MYPDVQLNIDGSWRAAKDGRTLPVLNPATGEVLGAVAHADTADLDLEFGGSLYCGAVLAGWGWLYLRLKEAEIDDGHIVIQRGQISNRFR